MANDSRFIDALVHRIHLGIHTLAPARVVQYYPNTQEADIELLFLTVYKDGSAEKYPLIQRAPVLGMRYNVPSASTSISGIVDGDGSNTTTTFNEPLLMTPHLVPGDVVFVGFAERALDNLQRQPFDPDAHRMHNVRDAVVLGVFNV